VNMGTPLIPILLAGVGTYMDFFLSIQGKCSSIRPTSQISAFYPALYISIVQVNGFLLIHLSSYFDGRR